LIFFKKTKKSFSYNIKKVELLFFSLVIFFLFLSKSTFAENKLLMITADYCIYCQIWEKEIGKIYPKTEISKSFPLERIELDEYLFDNDINDTNNYETKITPTFVFYRGNNEIGRITGYSSAEMFWWQVDEILDRD
jgi:thioredoxin-related protein